MVEIHTNPGMVNDRVALDFSAEEIKRIKGICEELRTIFRADSVGITGFTQVSAGMPLDYQIKISGSPARLVFEDENNY